MTFIGRQTTDQQLINHLYETAKLAMKPTEFREIMQNNGHYGSRLFKVTDFGTNRKPIYDFLLVIRPNSNWPSILHHFQVTADYMQNFG